MEHGLRLSAPGSVESVEIIRIVPGVFKIVSDKFADSEIYTSDLLAASKHGSEAKVVVPENGRGVAMVNKRFRDAKTIPRDLVVGFHEIIEEEISKYVAPALETYLKMPFIYHEGAQIVHYEKGGKFSPHTDSGALFPRRFMTLIRYINDDYSGGETEFFEPALSYKGTRTTYLAFYSEMLHASKPILDGNKLIFVTWYVSDPHAV